MQVVPAQHADNNTSCMDADAVAFWRRMADLVPGILYIFNHEKNSNEYSNRAIGDILGYSPGEMLQMGDNLFQTLVHPDDLPRLGRHLDSMRSLPDGGETHFEYRVRAKDGGLRWLRSVDSVFERAEDGTVLRHVGVATDITAVKEAELALREVNRNLEERVKARTADLEVLNSELGVCVAKRSAELQEVNRDLKDLTYIATHDLRGPINNLSSLTHMLSDAEALLPPEHVETLGWMRDVCHQASDKLDALICVAQAHSSALDSFEEVDLEAAIEGALVNLHYQISKARALIATDIKAKTVWFVDREMENILQSVIGNAIKYQKPKQRPRISVTSCQKEGHVEIEISDNGTGLDLPTDESKVFGLFQRAHIEPEGTGVSLYAIRKTLERVGGKIDVSSTIGEGSRFTICLQNGPQAA
ncbi:PAS domain-containing sensor histidine kinase [Roseobacter sp. YSTF-M11]|uniref:histidine kinase n=1 Tax=Roseobacter insulae TaxID=2859783 RepID=A0A9X1K0P4_9RHOB|nr:PAS domain-containing sensor histidine kinase [Roseobacter insulae]MBW4710490.1 PAS domain-containing sensor histidine kinase [Roseobacter insulae]